MSPNKNGLRINLHNPLFFLHQGIPFEVKIPNGLTSETLRKAEAGEDLNAVHSVDELFEELDR